MIFSFGVNPSPQYLIAGNIVLFWLIAGVGTVIGSVLYLLAAHPAFRKPKFRHLKRLSRLDAALIGVAIGGAIILWSYQIN